MQNHFFRGVRGQGVLEIIIALAVLTVGLSAAIIAIFGGQSLTIDSGQSERALNLARENLERTQDAARKDYAALTNSSTTDGIFLKEIIVAEAGTDMRRVTSRVSWDTATARPQSVELVALVTDWFNNQQLGGDTGGDPPSGDWRNPITLGSVDLGPGNAATDLDVFNYIVYISSEASDKKKDDFFIIDATNGSSPVLASSTNLGESLNSVDVALNYAYAGSKDTSGQLRVIDVSNIYAPVEVSAFSLPGVSGAGAVGNTVFYSGQRVYVGTKSASGPEFHIVDVSNPASPMSLGSHEIGADVNAIYTRGETSYLATSNDAEELVVLNIANPLAITEIGAYNASGTLDGKSVFHVGSRLYLGRLGDGNTDNHEFHILDISNPASIVSIGSRDFATDVNGITIRDYLSFLGTSESNSEFQIWNIATSTSISFWSAFNFPQVANATDYEDNRVYVGVRSNDALRIITSSP